ncbi:hypothetical protein, variant [Verruconis gallopava]|nr:hypothetical protein, variant [Verruconis gallopava]KIW09212.1 hypothetical protein, variant [Verruconis gallopava]
MNRPLATRKRGAPDASPLSQQQNFSSIPFTPAMDQTSFDPNFPDWGNANSMGGLGNGFLNEAKGLDSGTFDAAGFGGAPILADSQLVRRAPGQQVVSRNQNSWQDTGGTSSFSNFEQADDEEDLEQRALAAKKEALAKRKQIPPFVQKLSSFLDDNHNTDLIRWSDSGDSFIVLDEDEFARKLIPELFKHNNYASFVRQLNMYGFHKKVGLSDNSMKASENKRKTPSEYYNKYFKRGRPELLWLIQKPKNPPSSKRKREDKSGGDSDEEPRTTPLPNASGQANTGPAGGNTDVAVLPRSELNNIRQELANLQKNQKMITQVIQQMKQQNDQFYRQATAFQDMHQRHENSINAILTFLATFYNRSLEGQNNMHEMFNQSLPQGSVQPGNIVDIGDVPEELQMPTRRSKQPLLLPAPEVKSKMGTPTSPATVQSARSTLSPQSRSASILRNVPSSSATPAPGSNPTAPSPHIKMESESPGIITDNHGMMHVINAANSASPKPGAGLDFDSALHHFQNADGNTPLTQQQRNDMLSLMQATIGGTGGGKSALTNPQTPPMPSLNDITAQNDQLDYLQRLTQQQDESVENLRGRIHSLSPTGYFAGLDNPSNPPPDFNLDDWMLPPPDTGDLSNLNFDDLNNGDADFGTADGLLPINDEDPEFDGQHGFLSPEQGGNSFQGGKVESISSRATTASPKEALKADGE